jgi:hypothetical protein
MIIWRGWGVIVIGVFFLCDLVANALANALGGNGYWDSHGWPMACALILAGGIIWAIDAFLAKRGERVLVDEQTGQRVVFRKHHDFFFVRLKWWGLIFSCLAVVILVTRWSPGASRPHVANLPASASARPAR